MTTQSGPIFIIGVHRSGTTLLRYMLNSHPRIYIPPESDFIPRFFLHRTYTTLTQSQLTRLLAIIFGKYRFVKEWQGAPPAPQSFLPAFTTPAAFLDRLYTLYAEQNAALRWGDKTPIYSSYVPLLDALFPTAQFIHLIRDGRDAALSMIDKWGAKDFHIDIYFAARNWLRRTNQARAEGSRLGPQRYYELKYEDLVANPQKELLSICAFLGENYTPEMASPHHLGQQRIEAGSFHDAVRHPPSTQRVARWQSEMFLADQRLFQHIAGGLLSQLGYPLTDLSPMPPAEKARLATLAAKYTLLQSGRNLLQIFKIMPPI
ncbi:MAG: sulfotransferase [Anaerolineales bacterium]|nr:sulfotransferase [Anaerolineales bacterium]